MSVSRMIHHSQPCNTWHVTITGQCKNIQKNKGSQDPLVYFRAPYSQSQGLCLGSKQATALGSMLKISWLKGSKVRGNEGVGCKMIVVSPL